MQEKIKYTNEELGKITVISDFLPPVHELNFNQETESVTLTLNRRSVDFLKSKASKEHLTYQDVICQLIDNYVNGLDIGVIE